MIEKFSEIAKYFSLNGEIDSFDVISYGHINQTYCVHISSGEKLGHYVFQKINVFVFKNPKRIMKNIERITAHIAAKLEEQGKSRDGVMHFLKTEEGKNYYIDDQGFWRISEYVPNSISYNVCDCKKLRSAGRAFGEFQTMLADFDASSLYETIPGFHDTRSRIAVLMRHYNEDPCDRAEEVKEEIAKISALKQFAIRFNELLDAKVIPLRVTHNDTKTNNVLFDKDTEEAKTVIDLDTVMPGLVAFDFGDAIRFAANTAAEDEADLSRVGLDIDRFRAFAEGFIPCVAKTLTPIEIETLALGAFVMSAECGIRFLDDYIVGDQYFKISYRNQNLIRARCQIHLAEDILAHMDELNQIVYEIASRK